MEQLRCSSKEWVMTPKIDISEMVSQMDVVLWCYKWTDGMVGCIMIP